MNNKVLGKLVWLGVAVVGAWALGSIATHRGETINATLLAVWYHFAIMCRITRCC